MGRLCANPVLTLFPKHIFFTFETMKKIINILCCLLGTTVSTMHAQNTLMLTVEAENTWTQTQTDAPIVLRLSETGATFQVRSAIVKDGETEIPSQLDDLDGDMRADELAFVVTLPAQTKKSYTVTLFDERATTPILHASMPK